MTVPPAVSTNQTCLVYRAGRQKREVLSQPQGNSAPSLAARKGIAGHYGVGQPNHTVFGQGFSRGRGGQEGRAAFGGARGANAGF